MLSRLAAWGIVGLTPACGGGTPPPAPPVVSNGRPPVVMEQNSFGFGSDAEIPADDADVFGAGSGSPAIEPTGPAVGNGPPVAPGLAKPAIRAAMRAGMARIRFCYEEALVGRPTLTGTTLVSFAIAGDGMVTSATGSGFDLAVDTCVADVVKTLVFPAVGSVTAVNYPFAFKLAGG